RAYGSMSGSEPMFFPADREGNVVMNEKPASPQKDYETFVKGYVPVQVEVLPAYYELVGPGEVVFTTRDGERVTRKYGRVNGGSPAFYAVDETGAVPEDAERVDPAEDYSAYVEGFGAAKPSALPVHYKTAGDALYAFEGRDGETRYRVFGRLDGAEPAYYEAAAEGTPVKGAAPINPDDDFERYIKGFTAMEPKDPPAYYEAVGGGLFAVTDRVGQKVYRSYGVKDGCEPAYYSADERGSVAEDAAPVSLADDFERYIAGFEPIARDEKDVPLYYYPTDNADVWTFMDINGKAHFRVYGVLNRGKEAYYYPCDEEGNVNTNALPVRPASDLAIIPPPKFAEVTPAAVPDFYYTVREGSSLYAFADREGESIYRVFGAYGRAMPQFYPANAEGIPVEDAAPVDPEKDFEAYFKGFEPQPSKAVPPQYTLADESKGLYSFTARDGETLYRVYGTLNRGGAAGFFPADEEGNPISEEPVQAKAERALMSTPVTFSIITLRPRATPDSTPLVRIYTPKPKPAPTPAAYESAVPGVQITGTLAQVTREVTAPSPDPTAAAQVNAGPTEAIAEESAGEMATEAPAGSVAEEPVPETPATEEPTAELSAATETELPQTTGSPVETSSGLAGGWIALIVTAGAALLGGGGYAVFGKKKK
ncbi:MAG: hypothetical protein FWF69_09855, partial [Firmicutes bacterium]|nr:hypothetical protein [Bacillota bacterium]